jgi:hypothetical protein
MLLKQRDGDLGAATDPEMAWAKPQFSRSRVDQAGRILVGLTPDDDDEEAWDRYFEALEVINNWRSSHSFPLNTLQVGLRRRAKNVAPQFLVAQRIKRLSSIDAKLRRFQSMQLSQMQDIGGCRAIVPSVSHVRKLVALFRKSGLKHELYDVDDYIEGPQKSGYRGVHLKYRYHSDRQATYNGLRIEIQIRSQLQHAWATAVEIVGTMSRQALKSSQGEAEWLRFFALMGSAIAQRERSPLVPETPSSLRELKKELRAYAAILNVDARLTAYGSAIRTINESEKGAHYYLLKLEPGQHQVTVTGFKANELQRASDEYLSVEKSIQKKDADAVLVSVDRIENLRRAYPNYFLDTGLFLRTVQLALRRSPGKKIR